MTFTPLQVRTLWLTAPVILGAIVYLIALDAVLYAKHGDQATISATYGKLLRLWPIVNTLASLFIGLVTGHLIWGKDWSRDATPLPPTSDPPPTDR